MQNTNNIITNGILGPNAIAIDGAGNIFVQNNYIYVAVYGKAYGFAPPTSLIRTMAPQYPICGIALDNGTFCLRRQQEYSSHPSDRVAESGNYSAVTPRMAPSMLKT